jgi:hypothetical protein
MRRFLLPASTAIILTAAGCNAARSEEPGPSVSRSYQVGAFDRIEVAGPYQVSVTTGSAPSVRATGPDNAIDRMVVEVEGGKLKIHPRKTSMSFGWSKQRRKVVLQVTVPSLRGAEIAGSGDITVDKVSVDHFAAGIAGSGALKLGEVQVQSLALGIAGSGGAQLGQGKAARVEYEIAGSGDIDGSDLAAEQASVSIAGSGNVVANASATADVDIAGSGDVRVTGGAKCNVSKHGSGNVTCG